MGRAALCRLPIGTGGTSHEEKSLKSVLLALALCLTLLPTAALTVEPSREQSPEQNETTQVSAAPEENEAPAAEPAPLAAENDIAVQASGTHTDHPICGADACNDHENQTWTAISSESSLKGIQSGGHYYLTDDIDLSSTWTLNGNVTLCLNGYSIQTGDEIDLIEIADGGTLTLTNCQNTGAVEHTNILYYGHGVVIRDGGTFSLYNAKIRDNRGSQMGNGGAGVYMAGGTIKENIATDPNTIYGEGGVYINGETFTMIGGSITKNTASEFAGGVYVGVNATFIVDGNTVVAENTSRGVADNVYLRSYGSNYKSLKTITIDPSLEKTARIGVRTGNNDATGQIATGASNADFPYAIVFTPDRQDKGFYIERDASENTLYLSKHTHTWKYKLSTTVTEHDTITAYCDAAGCSLEGGLGGTLTLVPPTNPIYDGQAKRPDAQPDSAWSANIGAWEGVSTYYRDNTNVASPIDAGNYKVKYYVTGGEDAVAEVTYTIGKATPRVVSWNGYQYNHKVTGAAIEDPTSLTILLDGKQSDLVTVDQFQFNWYAAVKNTDGTYEKGMKLGENPTDAGDYVVEAVFAGTDNINAVTSKAGLTIGKAQTTDNVNVPLDVYPAAAEREYVVDIAGALNIPHGGSLELNANFGDAVSSGLIGSLVKSAVWDNGKLKVTMNALSRMQPGGLGSISVHLTSKNYDMIPILVNITLNPKQEKKDISVSMESWTYGEAAREPAYTVPSGVTEEITYAIRNEDGTNGEFSKTVPTNAGSYTVKVTYETDTEVHTGLASFTIAKKKIDLPAVTDKTYTYNGSAQTRPM